MMKDRAMKMKRPVILGIVSIGTLILLSQPAIANELLGLFLTGTIKGTGIVIPYWGMMALYCTVSSLLVAWYIESLIVEGRTQKIVAKQRMQRRRYSHM